MISDTITAPVPVTVNAEALTYTEKRQLAFQEQRIESGKSAFIAVADALMAIRDQRLYRETHGTFEAYYREKWGFARSYASRLLTAAEVVEHLPSDLLPMVNNERKARELVKVPLEQRGTVVREAVACAEARGAKLTARDIAEIARPVARVPRPFKYDHWLKQMKPELCARLTRVPMADRAQAVKDVQKYAAKFLPDMADGNE